MQERGIKMAAEIAETPRVYNSLISNYLDFEIVKDILPKRDIKSILILARGTSDNAAHFLKYLIETQIGLPVGLTSPSVVSIYNSKLLYENSLVIAISQSGQSPDLVKYAEAAKNAGAILISMTNASVSPMAKLADFHFYLQAGQELSVAATKSYSAQLMTSYLLVSTWRNKTVDATQIISETERLLKEKDGLSLALSRMSRDKEILFLGRGFAYPNAREVALKIQETCRISVQSYSTADYLHGPISALNSDTQVFIVAPTHFPYASIAEVVARIRRTSKNIFWIGNGGAPEPGETVLAGSSCRDEIESTIADTVVLQGLALEFAVKQGFDPDAPEGLSKVTLTI